MFFCRRCCVDCKPGHEQLDLITLVLSGLAPRRGGRRTLSVVALVGRAATQTPPNCAGRDTITPSSISEHALEFYDFAIRPDGRTCTTFVATCMK